MDRREMQKGAGGLSESVSAKGLAVVDGHIVATGGPFRWEDKSRGISEPPPYDPVAVLEAMRERGVVFKLWCDGGLYHAMFLLEGATKAMMWHSDFPSAVRWLHAQAAAVDPEFAKAWPVPKEA